MAACKIILISRLHISAKDNHPDFDFLCEHLTQLNQELATMMQAGMSFNLSMAVLCSKYANERAIKN